MSTTAAISDANGQGSDAPKGHPWGLYVLFATEMWERFSYYGMRALLVLYLVQHMGWQPTEASSVYKWYTSLVYLTPLLGGFLADRYLGLRASIITGGVLMAIGHFLMAFEALPFFYSALGFLILGNGFFKPNISTLVGKMYKRQDPRRDSAFTIFYMGINLGAMAAPWICGEWLRKHHGFHYGFGAAGVGMVFGLVLFLVFQKRVLADVEAAGGNLKAGREKAKEEHEPDPDDREPGAKGAAGVIARIFPFVLLAIAVLVPVRYGILVVRGEASFTELFMPVAFAAIAGWMGVTLMTIRGASRDKSVVIFVLFLFSVLFWMAFEQAGNALNLWAEFFTDRHIGSYEYSAESMQSVNPLLILLLGPVFAALWVFLARRGKEPSTPLKMMLAIALVAASFFAMVGAATSENTTETRVKAAPPPKSILIESLNAGRLRYESGELVATGAVASYVVSDALKQAAPKEHLDAIQKLAKEAEKASADAPAAVVVPEPEGGFALPFDAEKAKEVGVSYDVKTHAIVATKELDKPSVLALEGAGAPASWREGMNSIAETSQAARVSGLWLLLSYLLATLGELCLSPVGLSMVTKLAPIRYSSLFMGVWLLSNSVAQYVGGSIGETWGKVAPTSYFWLFVWSSLAGVALLLLLVRPLRRLMHNVH